MDGSLHKAMLMHIDGGEGGNRQLDSDPGIGPDVGGESEL